MDIKDSYLHGTVGVVKSISVNADKLSYKLADVAGTTKTVTLSVATQTANGLLSKEDKKKLDNMIATRVANDLILKINSGTTEGTSLYTYNGSSAKTLDIKSGTGIGFTNNAGLLQIYNSGVRSIATGTTNGTISVNTNGTSKDVAVKGLGDRAFDSTEYLPLTGGTITGNLIILGTAGTLIVHNPNKSALSLLKFTNSDKSLGFLGFTQTEEPLYWTGDASAGYALITGKNYSNYLPFLNSSTTHAIKTSVIYAPNTAGIKGLVLVSNGSGAPVWSNLDTTTSGNTNYLKIHDIRNTEHSPISSEFPESSITAWFLNKDIPNTTWSSGITVRGFIGNDRQVWQLASGATISLDNRLYYRNGIGDTWQPWKQIAFTDSDITGNAATATHASTADKLKTKRKLWGLDFDGTADVGGTITISSTLTNNRSIQFPGGEFFDGSGNFYLDGTNEVTNSFNIFKTNTDGTNTHLFNLGENKGANFYGTLTAPTFMGNLAWSYITNKPTSFTPSAHTHSYITIKAGIDVSEKSSKYQARALSCNTVYDNNFPTLYGNTITVNGSGSGLFFISWSGGYTDSDTQEILNTYSTELYLRNRRDNQTVWTGWTRVLTDKNYGTYVATKSHEHTTNQITALTGYSKATSASNLATTDTLNSALGKLEYKADTAYDWYKSVTGTDNDDIINKWEEIVGFLDSVKEGTDILDEFVTRKTLQEITASKTFRNLDGIYFRAGNYGLRLLGNGEYGYLQLGLIQGDGTKVHKGKITGIFAETLSSLEIKSRATTATGTITATKFITSGGTSTLFVKGDGSLDSTTYATTTSLGNYVTLNTDQVVSGKKLFNNQLIIRKDVGATGASATDQQHNLLLQVMRYSDTHSVAIGVMPTGAGVIWAKANGIGYNTLYLNPHTTGVAIGCGDITLPQLNDGYYFHIFGATLSNSTITATKFIKSGGTSSQFLKADGSVDSNTYLTSHQSLANYVTLNSALTISGVKTFSTLLKFTVALGTSPFTVTSTTKVTNLNADLLDGLNSDDFFRKLGANEDINTYADDSNKNGILYINTTTPENINAPFHYGSIVSLSSGAASWMIACSSGGILSYRSRWWSSNGNNWGNWNTFIHSGNYTNYVNTTNFPGLNKTGTVTSVTVTGANGLSGTGTVTTSGTITLSNAGVRSTTINGNYLQVNTNGTNADLTIPYATTASLLNNTSVSDPSTAASGLRVKWYSQISQASGYAGTNYGFPVENNANGILWLGTHSGPYGWLMGFSSNGRIYARYISNNSFSTAANGGSWKRIAWTSDIPTVTNYYWANVKISSTSSTTTTPTFANVSILNSAYNLMTLTRSGSTNGALIAFANSNGTLGHIGMKGAVNGGLYRYSADATSAYLVCDANNSSVSGGGSSWGSSITVKINNTTATLTIPSNPNTWRPITDSYSGTTTTTSLSQKGANDLYNAVIGMIPTVNNGKITIKLNGTEIGSFTMNQSSAGTINLTDTTYGLVGANGTTGLIKNGSTVTTTTGYIACPIINGVPYYWDTTLGNSGVTAGTYTPTPSTVTNSTNQSIQVPELTINASGLITKASLKNVAITGSFYIASNKTLTNSELSFITSITIAPGYTVTFPTPSSSNEGKIIFVKAAYGNQARYVSGKIAACNSICSTASTTTIDIGYHSHIFVCMDYGSGYAWVDYYCG